VEGHTSRGGTTTGKGDVASIDAMDGFGVEEFVGGAGEEEGGVCDKLRTQAISHESLCMTEK
jgi:hypothetical protein